MKKQNEKDIKGILLEIVDGLCETENIIEKADVLTADILDIYLECSDLKTERVRYIAQYDLKIASVKAEMANACITLALGKVKNLCKISNMAFEAAKE